MIRSLFGFCIFVYTEYGVPAMHIGPSSSPGSKMCWIHPWPTGNDAAGEN